MSEKKQRRSWTPDEKAEIVLAGLRGDRSVRDVCREHEISEAQYYQWRDRLLEGGKAACVAHEGGAPKDAELKEAEETIAAASRAGARPQDLRIGGRGGTLAGLDVSVRVVPEPAEWSLTDVAHDRCRGGWRVSRQAIYKHPNPAPTEGRSAGEPCDLGTRRSWDRQGAPDRRHAHGRRDRLTGARRASQPQTGATDEVHPPIVAATRGLGPPAAPGYSRVPALTSCGIWT